MYMRCTIVTIIIFFGTLLPARSQPEVHRYRIDLAGARIGTMTVSRETLPDKQVRYTQTSDVQVNLLVYKLKVYYQVVSLFKQGQLMLATVDAHSNQDTYRSRTEWTGNQYTISARQYKYERTVTENRKIDFTVAMLYFSEPIGRQQVYAEYFGDYFRLTPTPRPSYRAQLADREDEYCYERGKLVRVIKKNSVKNFTLRLLE